MAGSFCVLSTDTAQHPHLTPSGEMQPFSSVLLPRPRRPSLLGGGGQWVARGLGRGGASSKETTHWEWLPAEPPAASGGAPGLVEVQGASFPSCAPLVL